MSDDSIQMKNINPIFEIVGELKLANSIFFPYFFQILLKIDKENMHSKLRRFGEKVDLVGRKNADWVMIYKGIFLVEDNETGLSRIAYCYIVSKAKEIYSVIKYIFILEKNLTI